MSRVIPEYCGCLAVSARLKGVYKDTIFQLEKEKARGLQRKGELKIVSGDDANKDTDMILTNINLTLKKRTLNSYLGRTDFTKKKELIKIAWVQDYSKNGGAELSNFEVVRIGELLGFDIVGVSPTAFIPKIMDDADLIVLNNLFEFNPEQIHKIYWAIFENRKPFIKYDHDMRELKRLHKTRCLFERSRLNVFISPLHMKQYNAEHIEGVCFPLAIDVDAFKSVKTIERKANSVIVPCIRKGIENMKAYILKNKEKEFTIINNNDLSTVKNVKILGSQPTNKMNEIFSRYEEMLHLPKEVWAGERIYFECQLCGCKPIVNDNVGHFSWGYKSTTQIRNELKKASYEFWKAIERVL